MCSSDLPAPSAPPPEEELKKPFPLVPALAGVVVLLGVAGGGFWWKNRNSNSATGGPATTNVVNVPTSVAPPAAKKPGSLFIESTPPGATVIVDGSKIGVAPTNFPNLEAGEHKLLIRFTGFEDERKTIAVPEGDVLDVKVALRRQAGELRVESTPAAARFTVRSLQGDGAALEGVTPLKTNLTIGRYVVTLQRPGHADFTSTNTLERDNPAVVSHEFPEGALDIKSTPPGVGYEVLKDGKRLFAGLTPTNFAGLPAGSYQVKMSKEGFKPFDDAVAVTRGGATPVHWDSTDKLVRGGFTITSEPPGAVAAIPSQAPKLTPATFSQLAPGKFTVTFRLDGYEDQTKEIEVKGDASPNLGSVKLERSTGTLLVASKPPGATFEVTPVSVVGTRPAPMKGSTKAGGESLKLPTGTYKVALARPGWPAFAREEVTVTRNGSAPVNHEFEEGSLSLSAQPAGAKFTINGQATDKFPVILPPGPVQAVASLAGRPSLTNNFALEKDQQLKHDFVFPASLVITPEPKGAEVKLNGKVLGKANPKIELAGLAPGEVKLEIAADGYVDRATNVTVAAGEARQLQIKLAKKEAPKLEIGRAHV